MALYQKKQQKLWVWIAIDNVTKQVLGFSLGGRGFKTAKRLFTKLESTCKVNKYATDAWKVYRKIISQEKHIIGKKFTTNIENLNGRIRHFLARFRRKTYCYSKSIEMVEYSLYVLFYSDI